jgi:hypothetical protein
MTLWGFIVAAKQRPGGDLARSRVEFMAGGLVGCYRRLQCLCLGIGRMFGGRHVANPARPSPAALVASSSAHRFLHERGDLLLVGGGQFCQREGGRPHGAFVEVRRVLEAER